MQTASTSGCGVACSEMLNANCRHVPVVTLKMPSFPLMVDLPPVLCTKGWDWEQIVNAGHPSDGHWLATDTTGHRWLTKLRGSFYAYREITFAKLAQGIGWSCQSSTYIKLDAASAAIVGAIAGEVHAAHWYMEEHASKPCCVSCPIHPLVGLEVHSANDLDGIDIAHLFDWPKSEFAAFIFGANEPSGRLFTLQHEFVIIDNEQMFSTGPCSFESDLWVGGETGAAYSKGLALASETCADVASITTQLLTQALAIPRGVKVDQRWPIAQNIKQSIKFASQYATHGNLTIGSVNEESKGVA